jgi:hypothetical protein
LGSRRLLEVKLGSHLTTVPAESHGGSAPRDFRAFFPSPEKLKKMRKKPIRSAVPHIFYSGRQCAKFLFTVDSKKDFLIPTFSEIIGKILNRSAVDI